MTPQWKANELIEIYEGITNPIECAIATCDQVLLTIDVFPNGLDMLHEIDYWKEIKHELQKKLKNERTGADISL